MRFALRISGLCVPAPGTVTGRPFANCPRGPPAAFVLWSFAPNYLLRLQCALISSFSNVLTGRQSAQPISMRELRLPYSERFRIWTIVFSGFHVATFNIKLN